MTNDEREEIEYIVSSGNRMRESNMIRNYPNVHKKVLNYIDLDISFREKLWYYYNEITEPVTCIHCDNITTFNKKFQDGYKTHCSNTCVNITKYGKREKYREKTIEEIVNNPIRLRESYVKKNSPTLYKKILKHINLDIPFKEKLWYYCHNIKEEFTCKCGNPTTFYKNFKQGYRKYCSAKCAQTEDITKEKRRQTTLEVYGVDNVARNSGVKEKIVSTNMERYGTKSTFQNEDVRKKWRENVKEKYGVDHIFQLEEVKKQIRNTNKEKYGTEYYFNSEDYADKMSKYDLSSLFKELHKQSHIEKYKEMGFEFIDIKDSTILTLREGDDVFIIHRDTLKGRLEKGSIISTTRNPLNFTGQSESEKEIQEYIKSLNIDEFILSDRKILEGRELDIYIPKEEVAFEYNGIYWHSDLYKKKNHHFTKTSKSNENNIKLFHVWEDDWLNRKELVKKTISKILNKTTHKTTHQSIIKELDNCIAERFILENDIHKLIKSDFYYGIYEEEELLSIIGFDINFSDNNILINNICDIKDYIIKNSFKHLISNISSLLDITEFYYLYDKSFPLYNMKSIGFKKSKDIKMAYWFLLSNGRIRVSIYDFEFNIHNDSILFTKGFNVLPKIWDSGKELYIYDN